MESIEEQVYLAVSNGDVEKSLQLIAMGLFFFGFIFLLFFTLVVFNKQSRVNQAEFTGFLVYGFFYFL